MRQLFNKLRDTFFAGVIFLLPLLVVLVLLTKAFQFLTGFTTKIAAIFGLKSVAGISGSTVVSTVSLILCCILCGYLVRISLFKRISKWLDRTLMNLIPGYSVYREMAISKIDKKEEAVPYECVAFINGDDGQQPAFLMEKMADGKLVIFVPFAGNPKEGQIVIMTADKVQLNRDIDMKAFRLAINNLGLGLSKV